MLLSAVVRSEVYSRYPGDERMIRDMRHHQNRLRRWEEGLPTATAKPVEKEEPKLCIYCTTDPIDKKFDPYCSVICSIAAEQD